MIKILIAEDHLIVRNGIRSLLEQEKDFQVTGEAGNGLEVLAQLDSGLRPDILLTDLSMPDMDGLELTRQVSARYPESRTIILSMLDQEKHVFEAFEAGAKGYLLKNSSLEEMINAVRLVAADREVVCSELAIKILRRAAKSDPAIQGRQIEIDLSNREKEVLILIAEGHTNEEIADKVFCSRRTVEGHRQSLINKLGARNTAQLIYLASKKGLL
ncbi:MAG TPA: response regulator transcription factor [Sphingobacteriaceae bacterium]